MGEYYGKDKDDNLLKLIMLSLVSISIIILFSLSANAIMHPVDLPRTLTTSTDQNYAEMNSNRYFQVWYGDDPSTGNVVKFSSGGVEMTLLPMALNWNNDFSQLQQISMPQSVSGSPSGSNIIYNDAYGSGIDLIYETQQDKVKESLIISSRSDLTDPAQYVIDGGNVQLELGFQFTSNGKIYVDDVEWSGSETTVTGDLVITDSNDNPVYTLPRPFATDSNSIIVYGHYVLKTTANKLYVRIYIPYNWLNDTARVYPVTIDPTFSVDYSPIPASHLIDGVFNVDPDYDYTTITDITSEMSDLNDSTFEDIFTSTIPESGVNAVSIKFEETSGNVSKDYGYFSIDADLYNSPNLNVGGASGSGIDFDGVNDYGIIPRYTNISSGEDMVFCLALHSGGIGSIQTFIDNKGGGNAQGMEFTMTSSDTLDFFVRRGAVQTTISGTIDVSDSVWHKACGVTLANGTVELWLDGVKDVSATGVTGVMVATEYIYLGTAHSLGQYYSQALDEICNWRGTSLDEQTIIQQYNDSYCGLPEGNHIAGSWNETYDANYTWYLALNKISLGSSLFEVRAYDDLENISTELVTDTLTGIGWHYILVDGLMDYMTNNQSLDYTKLRVTSTDEHNISELWLSQWGNDTLPPVINDCYVNTTTLDCGETARLECNITDDFFVTDVYYQINGVNYTVTEHTDDFWYYDLSPIGFDVSILYDWEYTYAFDIVNLTNVTDPNIQINYTCVTPCIENWTLDPFTCLINDTYIALYTDQNSCNTTDDLPAQNGTEQYCNYCSEDLVAIFGTCQSNSSQSVSWHDGNFFSCCFITNLPSDCSILTYPYNETTSQNCTFYTQDLGTPICPEEFTFKLGEKEYCLVEIPQIHINESFKCMAYVMTDTPSEIIQVTPEYKEPKTSLIGVFTPDSETRQYFTPANGFVNVYITKKNLLPEYDYFLHISCKSDQRTLESVHPFTIGYENVEFVFFRTRWLMSNAGYIIGGILLLFVILAILIVLWKGVK